MKFYDVFTPGAPPHSIEFLVGRKTSLENLKTYLKSPGIHPIVVGPRGIGKTSLVQFIVDEYEYKSQVEANTVEDFDELARCILDDLGIDSHRLLTIVKESEETKQAKGKVVVAEGSLRHKKKSALSESGLSGTKLNPQMLKKQIMNLKQEAVISIDELDDLKKSDITIKLAKFAKSCSNQARWIKPKFIFSGIGRDAHSLFGSHLSSQRNHPVIYLGSLTKKDFYSFFKNAEKKLGVVIPSFIKNDIIEDADGFPYYMHQVCFHMFDCFEKDKSHHQIIEKHYDEGKKRAFHEAFSHYLRTYKFTVYKLKDLDKTILGKMVQLKKRHYNYHQIQNDLYAELKYSVKEIQRSFRYLRDNKYISYRKSDNTVSFYDALLKPFLRSKLKIKEIKNDPQLFLFNDNFSIQKG